MQIALRNLAWLFIVNGIKFSIMKFACIWVCTDLLHSSIFHYSVSSSFWKVPNVCGSFIPNKGAFS